MRLELALIGEIGRKEDGRLTDTDDTQTLMDEDGVVGDVVATPIRTAVLDLLAHANGRGPELLNIGMSIWREKSCERGDTDRGLGRRCMEGLPVASEDTTHFGGLVYGV